MERTKPVITVVIADDHPMVRAGLAMLLRAEPDIDVIAEANDGFEAVELTRRHAVDVVLMDLRMPGQDGITATRMLTAGGEEDRLTKVLALTVSEDDDMVFGALQAGASGFLLKRAAPEDLVAAIRRVASGDAWIDPGVAGRVIAAMTAPVPPDRRDGLPGADQSVIGTLTAREREVLTLMAEGLTNTAIRQRLALSEGTVKTHVSRVLMKTGAHDRAQAVALAYRTGLVKQ